MAAVITLIEAKIALKVMGTDHDPEVQMYLEQADATIRDYLKTQNDPSWDSTTAPLMVKAATLRMLANLYEHRGDQYGMDGKADDQAWEAVANLLRRLRDPALA